MDLNKSNIKKIMFLITFSIILFLGISNISTVISKGDKFIQIIWPFILGVIIAFILNVPMSLIEKKIFKNKEINTKIRTVSVLLTLFLIIIISVLISFLIIPELVDTFTRLINRLPSFFDRSVEAITNLSKEHPFLEKGFDKLEIDWDSIKNKIFKFIKTSSPEMLNSGILVAQSVVSGITNALIAFIFALYILFQKETLSRQARMLSVALLPRKHSDRVSKIASLSYKIFSNFLSGQFLEAIILGAIFLVILTVFGFPYAMLISLIISITALVPIVGAFAGCLVGAFLILIEDPKKALIFIIVFLIIQQIEGNLIYPRVVGGSIGLPAIWVLVAVILGGATFGIMGVIFFIPLFSILYTLIREMVYNIIKTKNIPKEAFESSDNLNKE